MARFQCTPQKRGYFPAGLAEVCGNHGPRHKPQVASPAAVLLGERIAVARGRGMDLRRSNLCRYLTTAARHKRVHQVKVDALILFPGVVLDEFPRVSH